MNSNEQKMQPKKSYLHFHKSDIVKMGGTAVITALAICLFNLCPGNSKIAQDYRSILGFSDIEDSAMFAIKGPGVPSERISWDAATRLMDEYLNNNTTPLFTVYTDENDNTRTEKLRGLMINARQLDTIINHNPNPNGMDSTADNVIIYFGKRGVIQNPNGDSYPKIKIIALGTKYDNTQKKDTLMIKLTDITNVQAASVYDKASPCPGSPGCPTN